MNKLTSAVFLDRDGVVVADQGYAHGRDRVVLVPGVAAALRAWNAQGRMVVLVTNQSGLGRGYFSEEGYRAFQSEMMTLLAREGAWIDHVEMCPHAPDANCECRKPKPGMILAACARFSIDPMLSMLIGDKETDLAAGRSAGIASFLYRDAEDFHAWATATGLLAPV